jgi:hypothetical protein
MFPSTFPYTYSHRRVELKHGNRLQLLFGRRPAGMAIRAISWLGPEHGSAALQTLKA